MEDIKQNYIAGTIEGISESTEDILDFANMVFSMSYNSVDFAKLLPKAYSKERCNIPFHHIIKENHKIRGLIDIYPVNMSLDDINIMAAYIGTVSVHPNARSKGYLTQLMENAEKKAVEQGFDLMILDGNRHRYMHYGFERAGIKYSFNVDKRNIVHCCYSLYDEEYMERPVYSFEEIDKESKDIDVLFEMYMERNVTARTKEDFLLCLQSSHAVTYTVLKDEMPVGYINVSADEKNVLEFELTENSELPRVIYDLMEGIDITSIGITVGMDEIQKIEYLEKMCDYCNASMSHQIKVINYDKVLRFLFKWKQKYDTLVTKKCIIGIRNDRNYMIDVTDNDVNVYATDKKADVIFEKEELVRVFTTSMYIVEKQKGNKSKIRNIPEGWLPLPFYLPDGDAF